MDNRTFRLSEPSHHTRAEFESAIASLGAADRVRLRRIALGYWGSSRMAPDELINEACLRTIRGSRPWPADMDVVKFLAGVIRSVASAASDSRKSAGLKAFAAIANTRLAEFEGVVDRRGVVVAFNNPTASPEELLIEREQEEEEARRFTEWRQALLDEFSDDYEAQLIVEGMLDGLRGEGLRDVAGLTGGAFDTKYKKVHRRIERLIEKRRQS